MKGANPGNSPIAGSSGPADPAWLPINDIIEGVRVRGVDVSERQLERWRDKKLLPSGVQEFEAPGHGGTYRFPPITIDLAVAIHGALREKDDLDWVGRQLWWRGFPMDESCWRPSLLDTAKAYAPTLRLIGIQKRRERDGDDDPMRVDTFADRVAPKLASKNMVASILASRIVGRISLGELPSVLRLILDVAGGIEPEFEPGHAPPDERLLIRAMDLSVVKTDPSSGEETYHDDKLAGQSLGLRGALKPMLADIAAAFRQWTLLDAASASQAELERARDDLTHVMALVPALYESTKWIYGKNALGLRFGSWLCRKVPEKVLRLFLLTWVLLRRVSKDILSPEDIAHLRNNTEELYNSLITFKYLSKQTDESAKLFQPGNLKRALSDKTLFEDFLEKVRAANLTVPSRDLHRSYNR